MSGYTKLFSEIIMSTVWRENDKTRIVWITMLAIRDRWHVVNASIPGLADAARVSISDCREALHILSSPDPDSRSKDFEGRRIKEVDGGWLILNGEKYRNKMSLDERREYNRIKQAEYRGKKKMSTSCVQFSTESAQTETETETEYNIYTKPSEAQAPGVSSKKLSDSKNSPEGPQSNSHLTQEVNQIFDSYCQSWNKNKKQYALSASRRQMIQKALKSHGLEACLSAVKKFRNDSFEDRAKFNGLEYLFGNEKRIDKWCSDNNTLAKDDDDDFLNRVMEIRNKKLNQQKEF